MNWEYIAGFFDGEGSCGLYSNRDLGAGFVRVSLSQNDLPLLRAIQSFILSNGVKSHIESRPPKGLTRKECYVLAATNNGATAFLREISPRLIRKKVLAQDLLRFRKLYPPFSRSLCGKIGAGVPRG